MNYYSFHIGDYAAHTRHLSHMEDLAYRRMLDLYYTSEKPLPLEIDRLAKLVGLRDHQAEVSSIVTEFFEKTDDGYRSKRCDEEIERYREKSEKAAQSANARWSKSEPIAKAMRTHSERNAKAMPDGCEGNAPNNQEPITNNQLVIAGAKAPAKATKGTRLATDWKLPAAYGNWALEKGLSREKVLTEAERFRNYWVAKSGRDAAKVDWEATWRNWILKAIEDQGGEKKTFVEKTQEFKDKQAAEFYAHGLGNADEQTLRELRLLP